MNTFNFNTTEGIEKNVRICYGCSLKNLQLLCVLAGGPLPEEERQTPQPINPTVSFNGSTIRVEAVRERPSIQSNQPFFNYLRNRRAIVGLNVDSRVLAIESATQWRFLSEEEKQIYMMQTCFAGSIEIVRHCPSVPFLSVVCLSSARRLSVVRTSDNRSDRRQYITNI